MSGPFPDRPRGVSRASFSSGQSRSSSQLRSDSRRPSATSSSYPDTYSPNGSRQHSFSAASPTTAGLVFPGPAQVPRSDLASRSSHKASDDDNDEPLESLSSPYTSYFPGPSTPSYSSRDHQDRASVAAQTPLPQSRQQSIDSNTGLGDLPTLTMPFPPPPLANTAPYARSPSMLASVDPLSSAGNLRPRSHLGPPSGLHKTPSSSSLSGTSSAYSYEAASPSPGLPSGLLGPSPNPSTSSGLDPPPLAASSATSVSVSGSGSGAPTADPSARSRSPPTSGFGDFARRGEGLGLGRGVLEPVLPSEPRASDSYGGAGAAQVSAAEPGEADATVQPRAEPDELVPTSFDEGMLHALCDLDCGTPLLLERIKQSMASCREASTFLKKRAQIEEEYARAMAKLARSSIENYSVGDGKAGSYVSSWLSLLRLHEVLGDNRLKFAAQLSEMSEELAALSKEVEKSRKATKDLGTRLEKGLQEQEGLVDKARTRFDSAAEELERLLVLKQGETITPSSVPHAGASGANPSKGRSFGKAMSKLKGPKNAAQFARQEEDVRSRMGQSSDAYRAQVAGAQSVRQEYFNLQLPRILRALKESVDELDLGTQYHLSRYAYLFEALLVTDGLTLSPVSPEDGAGLKGVVDAIDVREDFRTFMQQFSLNWQMTGQRGPRREGPADEGFPNRSSLSPTPQTSSTLGAHAAAAPPPAPTRPTFGVDLGEQMARDNVDVPRVLEKCAQAIELHGLDMMGIYRLSGTTSRVQRLKAALDRDLEGTDLLSDEHLTDINDTAAVLKLWFRELPEPLLTWDLYHQFIEVAKIENDRLRHIRLHERVNDLPDPNYATLKYLMGHLHQVAQNESVNQMSVSNLAIVFGPNLLGAPPPHLAPRNAGGSAATSAQVAAGGSGDPNGTPGQQKPAPQGGGLADMQWQCKAVETILAHFQEIFVE